MRAIAAVCLSCLAALAAFAAIVAATLISSNVSVSWASSDVEDDAPVFDELTNPVSSSQDNTLVDSTSSDTAISPTEMPLSSTPTFTEGQHWIELAMLRVRTYFTGVTCTDVQRAVRRVKWPDLPRESFDRPIQQHSGPVELTLTAQSAPGKLRNFKCWPTFGDSPETATNWTFDVNLYNTPNCGPKLTCSLLRLLGSEERKLSFTWDG